jgi:hypothetical protein
VAQGTDGRWHINGNDRAGNVMCPDFMQHEMTKKAKLTIEEVIALRLYTGPAFHKYNTHLRFGLSIATTGGGGAPLSHSFGTRALRHDDPRHRQRSQEGLAVHQAAGGEQGIPRDVRSEAAGGV